MDDAARGEPAVGGVRADRFYERFIFGKAFFSLFQVGDNLFIGFVERTELVMSNEYFET